MKKKIVLLFSCLLTIVVCQAQFPAPHSFTAVLHYLTLDEDGLCGDEWIFGATNCASFSWEAPDLSETEAQLIGYNIYCYRSENYYDGMEIPFSEGEIIAQTTYTFLQMEFEYIGAVWVTAVYSEPKGESEPSNIVGNSDLPTAIKAIKIQDVSFTYNKQKNGIEIKGVENISSFGIFNLTGVEIPIPTSDFINTKNMEKGVYVIKITTKEGGVISDKIIIE